MQFLVLTLGFLMSFLWNRRFESSSLESSMQKQTGIQSSIFDGGLDDLESFQAWAEEIKTNMSQAKPSLYEVFGEIFSSRQPIKEGDIIEASQRIMKEKQRTLRVPQAKTERTNFKEEEVHQLQLLMSTGQQKQTNFREEMKADSLGVS